MKVDDTTKLTAILHPRTAHALAAAGVNTLGDVRDYKGEKKLTTVKYVTVRTLDTLLTALKTGEAKPFKVNRAPRVSVRQQRQPEKTMQLSGSEKFYIPMSMVKNITVRPPSIINAGGLEFELTGEGVALFGRDIISKLYQASRR